MKSPEWERLPGMIRAAWWLTPSAICVAIYWLAFRTWFQQDDFAWLGLRLQIHSWRDILPILFEPMAQGTIRPLSERAFFIGLTAMFGIDPLPFRIVAFSTQFANLALLASITRRLTGSRTAGWFAPVLWCANSVLGVAMCWASAYNQILAGFFLLLAFRLWLRFIDTGERRYYIGQWAAFVLGFGALELNVVYPALAGSYAFLQSRKHLWRVAPMFGASCAYAALHRASAPSETPSVYAMHWDASILTTLARYWSWAIGPGRLPEVKEVSVWFTAFAIIFLTLGLVAFSAWKVFRNQRVALFFLSWFLIVLAPVLPLRDHFSDYYLTLPLLGLAMLGGWAIASGLAGRWSTRAVALAGLGIYLGTTLPVTRALILWHYDRGRAVETLTYGVRRAHELHPGKAILLTGVHTDLFWSGVFDDPFRLYGIRDVYLAPGAEESIQEHPELGEVADYVLAPEVAWRVLQRDGAVVYSFGGDKLWNVTDTYWKRLEKWVPAGSPKRIDVGRVIFEDFLGTTWYPLEVGIRWMPQRASVFLGGPATTEEKLYLAGYCPPEQIAKGPLHLEVYVDGHPVGPVRIQPAALRFEASLSLPPEAVGKDRVEISLEVERTFSAQQDPRPLGLAFGTFAIR